MTHPAVVWRAWVIITDRGQAFIIKTAHDKQSALLRFSTEYPALVAAQVLEAECVL